MTRASDLRSIRLVYENSKANKLAALKHGANYMRNKSNAYKAIRHNIANIVHLIEEHDKVNVHIPQGPDSSEKLQEMNRELQEITEHIYNLVYEIADLTVNKRLLSYYADREAIAGLISVNVFNSLQRYEHDNDDKQYTIKQLAQDLYQQIANLIEQD